MKEISKNSKLIHLLSLLFGFGSWIAMTSLWLELPLLTESLPEGWALGSFLNVMIQFANVGPFIYWWAKRFPTVNEVTATHFQMIIGALACLLLIFGWSKTFYIFGSQRSLVLFIASFCLAILDCTSSVTFLPFMARFDSAYLNTYLIGEGLSGFIPTAVAIIQGVGVDSDCKPNSTSSNSTVTGNQFEVRFSAEVFFASLLVTLLISWASFIALQIISKRNNAYDLNLIKLNPFNLSLEKETLTGNKITNLSNFANQMSKQVYVYLLLVVFWCNFYTFGMLQPLQPYSSLPYGKEIFTYLVIIYSLSYPAGCFLATLFNKNRSTKLVNILTAIGVLISAYIVVCAIRDPVPLKDTIIGPMLILMTWCLLVLILSYVKTIITVRISYFNGSDGLFWVGLTTQFGAVFGAAFIFVVVNFTGLFKENDSC